MDKELQDYYLELTSTSVKKRSNSYTELIKMFSNDNIRAKMENDTIVSWYSLFKAITQYTELEAEKSFSKDSKRKEQNSVCRKTKCTLMLQVLQLANEEKINIEISKLVNAVLNALNNYAVRYYYLETYLDVLKLHILNEKFVWSVPASNWTSLFNMIKSLCEDKECSKTSLTVLLTNLLLIIKSASMVDFPMQILRSSFPFINGLIRQFNTDSTRIEWECLFQVLIEFCKLNMYDCRKLCCQIGEDPYLLSYKVNHIQLKNYLLRFYLLQMEIHYGNDESNCLCYFSLSDWKQVLQPLHNYVTKEFHNFQRTLNHNSIMEDFQLNTYFKTFLAITVELFKEFNEDDFMMECSSEIENDHDDNLIPKRRKIGTKITKLIDEIEDNWNWLCVKILEEILRKYPRLMTRNEFTRMLHLATTFKPEVNETTNKYLILNIYHCLDVMYNIHENMLLNSDNHVLEIWKSYWISIIDNNLKFLFLYKKQLLLKLLKRYKDDGPTKCFNTDSNVTFRRNLLRLFASNFKNHLCTDSLTAVLLIGCTCQSWPHDDITKYEACSSVDAVLNTSRKQNYVYRLNSLTELIEVPNYSEVSRRNKRLPSFRVEEELLQMLLDILEELFKNNQVEPNNFAILLTNLISGYLNVKATNEMDVDEFPLMVVLENLLENHCSNVMDKNNRQLLSELFALNVHPSVFRRIRSVLSTDSIKVLFDLLNATDSTNDIQTIHTLILYCIPQEEEMSQTQVHVMDAILTRRDDYKLDEWCRIILMFSSLFERAPSEAIPKELFLSFLNVLLNICSDKYEDVTVIMDVLKMLKPVSKYAISSGNSDSLEYFFDKLLLSFYNIRSQFGPRQSEILLECFQQVLLLDPKEVKIESYDLLPKIVDYLKSDHHKISLTAIEVLLSVFNLLNYKKQKFMLEECHKLYCNEVLPNEREEDFEASTNLISLLHFYGGIINVTTLWRLDALYYLLEIIVLKMIDWNYVQTLLNTITKNVGYDLIQFHAKNLLDLWYENNDKSLKHFLHFVLQCSSYKELCKRFRIEIIQLVAQNDDSLQQFALDIGIALEQLMQESFAQLTLTALRNKKSQFTSFACLLQDKANILDNLEGIILEILAYVYDEELLARQYDFDIKLSPNLHRKMYDYSELKRILQHLESSLNVNSIMKYLLTDHPDKLQRIFLELLRNVFDTKQIEEMRVIQFHRYTLFVDLLLQELEETDKSCVYMKRAILSYVLNVLRLNSSLAFTKNAEDKVSNNSARRLGLLAGIYLKKLVSSLTLTSDLHAVLLRLINDLVTISSMGTTTTKISVICLEILEMLFENNVPELEKIIHLIDPFPTSTSLSSQEDVDEEKLKFDEINKMFNAIKNKNGPNTLKMELKNFIEVTKLADNDARVEGLRHLNRKLCECRSEEIEELYQELNDKKHDLIRHKDSIIHELIRVLMEYAKSDNWMVCSSALNCLGAFGPRDVKTIVLQQLNKNYSLLVDCKPEVFVTGRIVSHLMQLIHDPCIEVVTSSSKALHHIFRYKEAKLAADGKSDYGYGTVEASAIIPFFKSSSRKKALKFIINRNVVEQMLNDNEVWCPSGNNVTYNSWLTELTSRMLRAFFRDGDYDNSGTYMTSLMDLLQLKLEFCETLLPLLIYLIFVVEDAICCQIVNTQMNRYFAKHVHTILANDISNYPVLNSRKIVKLLLDVIVFVRTQQINSNSCGLFRLNYLNVAKTSQYCGEFCGSLYYAEIWCKERLRETRAVSVSSERILTQVQQLRDFINDEEKSLLQNILDEAYLQLGDIDAGQGCYVKSEQTVGEIIRIYNRLERWDCALLYSDLINSPPVSSETLNFFKSYGLYNITTQLSDNRNSCSPLQYEFAWRLSKWDVDETKTETKSFEECHYFAMKMFNERRQIGFNEAILRAKKVVMECIKKTSMESCKNLYRILMRAQCLKELEEFNDHPDDYKCLLKKWQNDIKAYDFTYIEPIQAQRLSILNNDIRRNSTKSPSRDLSQEIFEISMNLIESAKNDNNIKISLRIAEDLYLKKDDYNMTITMKNRVLFEKAQLTWLLDKDLAKNMLSHLINNNCEMDKKLKSAALRLYGNWLVETYSENPSIIITNYFLESIKLVQDEDLKLSSETFDQLAKYCDQQYQRFETYVNSSDFKAKIKMMERSRILADSISQNLKCTRYEKRAIITHDVQSKIDQNEIESVLNEKHKYLIFAFKYYLLSLRYDEKNNIRIFRVISLWLKNKENDDLDDNVKQYLKTLPSYKFIPVLPQLVPHLSNDENDNFSAHVFNIILRCATEHPYHALPLVMSIANANKDLEYESNKKTSQTKEPRLLGNQKMLNVLKKNGSNKLKKIIAEMEVLNDSLIEFAYHTNDDKGSENGSEYQLERKLRLKSIKSYDNVLLPTLTMKVDVTGLYNSVIGIHSFESKYSLVGGINAPKRISCVGTDGISRILLVKGQDDLRQDAHMQQVFNIMNELLLINKETNNLRIRTYKVVPLSNRSGVLEWVVNSLTIGQYLCGRDGAHQQYNPEDLMTVRCMAMMKNCANESNASKLQTFLEICSKLQPVFHKFFERSYLESTVWYERRRAYVQSVATSSMCGYVLGIGDRHVQNILIDKRTAEVIHIDFGIAFEQGRILLTPEMVPFRLTRDIEDGMGVFGVEGLFKISCERSLEVLRNNAQTILSILEVLLYDPLYTWAITPAQAHDKQFKGDVSNESQSLYSATSTSPVYEYTTPTNTLAERALSRLRSKLDGTECISYRTVKAEVDRLIHEARNPTNLSRMFHGWQAYL